MTNPSLQESTRSLLGNRGGAIAVSLLLHAAIVLFAVGRSNSLSYDAGASRDVFRTDGAIAITSVIELGSRHANLTAAEASASATDRAEPRQNAPADQPVLTAAVPASSQVVPQVAAERPPDPSPQTIVDDATRSASAAQDAVGAQTRQFAQAHKGGDATALSEYHGVLSRKLHQARVLPGMRAGGRVIVRFRISPAGDILSREIAHSSGIRALDEAALASIDQAAPFPPIPREASLEPLILTVPFDYVLR